MAFCIHYAGQLQSDGDHLVVDTRRETAPALPVPIALSSQHAEYADDRNFYKVEKWTKDGTKVDRLLCAGISLAKAQELFAWAIKHRPRIRLTMRQRTRVLDQWPPAHAC